MRKIQQVGVGVVLALLACSSAAPCKSVYKIDQVVPLNGKSPSWDYVSVDDAHDHIFLGRRASGVTVLGLSDRKEIGKIDNSEGANAAVLVDEFDRGYTINGDGTTTIFVLSTLKTLSREKIGQSADNAFYDPKTKQLVVTMGDDKLLAFLDAKSGKLLGKLAMKAEELEGAVVDGTGAMFIAERDINKVAKIDIAKRQVLAEYPTTGCTQPTGAAYDAEHQRIFFGCKGEKPVLLVMNAANGKVVATETIGRGNDGVAFDPSTHRVFTSNGIDGNLVVYTQVSADKYTLMQALTTRPIARTIAFDPKTKMIFTMTAEGMVDPSAKRNMRAGAFYPNAFFDNTFALFAIGQHEAGATKSAEE